MKNIKALIILLFITLSTIFGIVYTQDLIQKNTETIFLTSKGQKQYKEFIEDFDEKNIIIIKKDFNKIDEQTTQTYFKELNILKEKCEDICEIISHKDIPENFQSLFNLSSDNFFAFVLISELDENFIKNFLSNLDKNDYWKDKGQSVHLIGAPYTNSLLDQYSKSIKEVLFPSLFIGVYIFLLLFTRNIATALALFLPCISAASLSLITTKLVFHESNLIVSVVPLIMFVLSLSLVMHVYHTALEQKSISMALRKKKKPILLMITTTYIGFLSLYFSELQIISEFGVLSSSLILGSALITILWLTQIDKVISLKKKSESKNKGHNFLAQYFSKAYSIKTIIIISIVSIILGSFVFPKIKIITDATEYFPKSSGLKQSIDHVAKTVSGPPIIEIILEQNDDFNIEGLKKINEIEKLIQVQLNKSETPLKFLSLNYLVKKANETYTKEFKLPKMQIAYATLASKIPMAIKDGYPAFENKYRMTVLGSAINVNKYEVILNSITQILDESNIKYSYNGLYYHLMLAQKKMINTLFKSFLFSLLIISLIAFITFRKIRVFFIFMIVNIIPVLISFVFMKILGLSFNIATVMTYSISLGLIVDSSFHIIDAIDHKYSEEYFYKTVTTPIIQASILLALCFSTFALNNFLPIQQFGICLALILLIGMIFDLKILPRLYKI